MTIWVHGPTAWDTVVEIDSLPKPGEFIRATGKSERPGGSGLNVAMALASTNQEVGFLTYLGSDHLGNRLKDFIKGVEFKYLEIEDFNTPTLHALILKDKSGERTIIALEPTALSKLDFKDELIKAGDIFIFAIWRPEFKNLLQRIRNRGGVTLVGTAALADIDVVADVAIGSKSDVGEFDLQSALNRFQKVVLTDGARGAESFSTREKIHQPALTTQVLDATGAGDSFLAGYALGLAKGFKEEEILKVASAWSASAIASTASIPPSWSAVAERWSIK